MLLLLPLLFAACGADKNKEQEDFSPEPTGVIGPVDPAPLPIRLTLSADSEPQFGGLGRRQSVKEALLFAMSVWNDAAGREVLELAQSEEFQGAQFDLIKSTRDGLNSLSVLDFMPQGVLDDPSSPSIDPLGVCFSLGRERDILLPLNVVQITGKGTRAEVRRTVFAEDLVKSSFARGAFDFHSVAIHELGHALGLDHSTTDKNSVMYSQGIALQQTRRDLSATDKKRLAEMLQAVPK